ncbi:MAG: ComEA family DNA-binding protein [Nocardioidaceae bacterium]
MRSRKSAHEEVAEVARRRLALLSAELAAIRPAPEDSPNLRDPGGSGEPHALVPRVEREPVIDTAAAGKHAHRSVGAAASVGGWAHDRLPPPLQGRVRLTAGHVAVVALLVAGALGLTAWWVVRADGGSETLPPVTTIPTGLVSVAPTSPGPTSPGPTAIGAGVATPSSPSGSIVVDVAGKVRRPGIATLPLGSRVVDAVEAAGGTRPGVRLGALNLARVLTDGEQVVVGQPGAPGVAASAASAPGAGTVGATPMVNLNSASQAQLEELPGVGPVTAQAILAFRTEQGPFTAVDELLEVSGIGDATLAEIAPFATL